jgi:beta-glucanase (GH16 family)
MNANLFGFRQALTLALAIPTVMLACQTVTPNTTNPDSNTTLEPSLRATGVTPGTTETAILAQKLEPNVLVDSGFENSSAAWNAQELGPSAASIAAGGTFRGTKFLRTGKTWGARKQDVILKPNSVYVVMGYAKSTDGQPCFLRLKGAGENPSGDAVSWDEPVSLTSSAYGFVSKAVKTPANIYWAQVMASNTYAPTGNTGYCDFDEIKLVRIEALTGDFIAPSTPTNLRAQQINGGVQLSWSASSDNVRVTGYDVFDGGTRVAQVTGPSANLTNLKPGSTTLRVRARDAAGNLSKPAELPFQVTAAAPNLLRNPGFETADAWSLYPGATLEAGQGKTGRALKASGTWSGAKQDLSVKAGTAHTVSGWIKSLNGQNCTITFKGGGSKDWNEQASSSTNTWTRIEKTVTTPSSVTWAQVLPSGSGCLFDDIALTGTPGTTPPPNGTWKLVWADEFNGSSLDATRWNLIEGPSTINEELPYFRAQNASVSGGNLIIKTDKEKFNGRDFTSAHIDTRNKFNFKYGRIDVRALMPNGQGIKPDFWTLHPDCTAYTPCTTHWPPELDILEMLGSDPTKIYQSFHYSTSYHSLYPAKTSNTKEVTISDSSKNWHTYTVEWEPGEVRTYTDGIQTNRLNDRELGYVAYDETMYLILATTVGGNWAKAPNSSTVFPQYTKIDSVKYYTR